MSILLRVHFREKLLKEANISKTLFVPIKISSEEMQTVVTKQFEIILTLIWVGFLGSRGSFWGVGWQN